jgi:hypothetical protein
MHVVDQLEDPSGDGGRDRPGEENPGAQKPPYGGGMFEEKGEGQSHRKFQWNGSEGEQRREPEGLPEARIRSEGAEIPEPDETQRQEGHVPVQAVQEGARHGEEDERQ